MNKSTKIDQQTFIHVKSRLDYYRLSSSFPIQVTGLLSKLLVLLDENNHESIYQKENIRYQQLKLQNSDPNDKESSAFSSLVDGAMRMQLSKHVRQNNELHEQVMTLKQELSTLKHVVSKTMMDNLVLKNTRNNQQQLIEESHLVRERELFSELKDAKYKYNQLIDMVHSQSNTEHQYIKKLLKHNLYCTAQSKDRTNTSGNLRTRGVTANDLNQKQTRKSLNKHSNYTNEQQVQLLREKLFNREKQILRLKSKLQFDGINMNKILKDFNEQQQKEQRNKIKERVQYLQKENKKVKDQNQKMIKLGGDKQALREHIQKIKTENQQLKKKLTQRKKRTKQVQYSEKKEKTLNKRKLNQTTQKLQNLIKQKTKQQIKCEQLQKKQKIIQNNLKQLSDKLQYLQRQKQDLTILNERVNESNERLTKELENERLMKEYERVKFMERESELQSKLESNIILNRKGESNMNEQTNINEHTITESHPLIQSYKEQLNQTRNLLYSKQRQTTKLRGEMNSLKEYMRELQSQCTKATSINQNYKQQLSIIKGQLVTLKGQLMAKHQLQQTVSQLSSQLKVQKDIVQKQKGKKMRTELKLTQYQKISDEFNLIKEQYNCLQKSEKDKTRALQYKIGDLEQTINMKTIQNEQKLSTINSLETQLIHNNQKLRQTNNQLTQIDQQMHKLKLQNNKLQKKYKELSAQYNAKQQQQKNTSQLKESHHLNQIETLNRQLQKSKIQLNQQNQLIHQHQIIINSLQNQTHLMQKTIEDYQNEIENHRQRHQLYQMEIRQLKIIYNDATHL